MDSLFAWLYFQLLTRYQACAPEDGNWTPYIWKCYYWTFSGALFGVGCAAFPVNHQHAMARVVLLTGGLVTISVLAFWQISLLAQRHVTRSFGALAVYCAAPLLVALAVFIANLWYS